MIKEFVASTKGRLKLFYLPPYSPDLAPVEMVFSTMRKSVSSKSPRTEAELRGAIAEYVGEMTVRQINRLFVHTWK